MIRKKKIEQAIHHYQKALDIQLPETWPHDCRDTAYGLGRLLYDEKRYPEARKAFEKAHQAVEILRSEMELEASKQKLASENADLYAHLVHCCLLTGDESAAFEYAAQAKGRAFVDILAADSFDLSTLSESNPAFAADLTAARQLRRKIDAAINALYRETSSSKSHRTEQYQKIQQLEEQETAWWHEMAFKYPALTATQSVPPITTREACELAADFDSTLVEYYQHQGGWCAFVVTPDKLQYAALYSLDNKLIPPMKQWTKRLELRTGAGRAKWTLNRLDDWYNAVMAPLRPYLPSNKSVTLAPFGDLHLLPITAARTPSGRYASQEWTLSFVPSLSTLFVAWQVDQAEQASQQSVRRPLLMVAYAGIKGQKDYLPNVLLEAQAIANNFPQQVTLLQDDQATPSAVIALAPKRHVVHFGCHGDFNAQNPTQSGLMLAGGHLTVNRIITELNLKQAKLVTLAACRSGQVAIRQGEEHVGLQQAVMTAGARAVVASLWQVDDEATRHLFEMFYAKIADQHSPAQAMAIAAEAVRQEPKKAHPYYWAAFQVNGLAHRPIESGLKTPLIDRLVECESSAQYQVRGAKPMTIQELLESSYTILDGLTNYPDEILAPLQPAKRIEVMERMGKLCQQATSINDSASLLQVANALHDLAESIPNMLDAHGKQGRRAEIGSMPAEDVQEQSLQLLWLLSECHDHLKEVVGSAGLLRSSEEFDIDPNTLFWLHTSQVSLDAIWNNTEDDIYAELLQK